MEIKEPGLFAKLSVAAVITAIVAIGVGIVSPLIQQSNASINIHRTSNYSGSEIIVGSGSGLTMTTQLGNAEISQENGLNYMLITLTGDTAIQAEIREDRAPLNLAIVLDRSGSMSGQKLQYVKEAIRKATEMLDSRDLVSLVIYDNTVQTVYEPQSFNRERFLSVLDGVGAGGSTNLEGGLREGLHHTTSLSTDRSISRVILLSDGLANVGESTPSGLARIVEEVSGNGITVSTIGVGADYDENLMASVAMAGNGNYYFLEDPADAMRIFEDEFSGMVNTVARNIKVDLGLDDDFEITRAVGYDLEDSNSFQPHDIYTDREVSYLFEIAPTRRLSLGRTKLAEITLSYESTATGQRETVVIPVFLKVVEEEVNPLADDEVYKEYMRSYLAEELWQMDKELDSVNNEKALQIIDGLVEEFELADARLPNEFDEELDDLLEKQEYVYQLGDRDVTYDEEGRNFKKSNNQEQYNLQFSK